MTTREVLERDCAVELPCGPQTGGECPATLHILHRTGEEGFRVQHGDNPEHVSGEYAADPDSSLGSLASTRSWREEIHRRAIAAQPSDGEAMQ